MTIFEVLISFLWITWLLYWIISAFWAKRSIRGANWKIEAGIRIVIILIIILFLRIPALYHLILEINSKSFYTNPFIASIGFFISLLGFTLSIWARIYLGENWGMPTTVREKPELVTTGPYKFVRHPIYTGIIFATLGTMLVTSILWLIPLVFVSAYFIYSLKIEERDMNQQFPKEYKNYKKRTKALIPFIY